VKIYYLGIPSFVGSLMFIHLDINGSVFKLDFHLSMQSVPITTTQVVSLIPHHDGEVYLTQLYVIKFVGVSQ
jgi:hypothetical protein